MQMVVPVEAWLTCVLIAPGVHCGSGRPPLLTQALILVRGSGIHSEDMFGAGAGAGASVGCAVGAAGATVGSRVAARVGDGATSPLDAGGSDGAGGRQPPKKLAAATTSATQTALLTPMAPR